MDIKDSDLICQPCAHKAGLVKERDNLVWYVGKELSSIVGQYSTYVIDRTCIVCDAGQSKIHPLIEISNITIGDPDAEERISI